MITTVRGTVYAFPDNIIYRETTTMLFDKGVEFSRLIYVWN